MFDNDVQNNGNWEPYTSAFGDGTLVLAANTESEDGYGTERVVIAFFNNDGSVVETAGFYSKVSPPTPWNSNNDVSRPDGNPPRVAADKRDGATKYLVGNEATPWAFVPEIFPTFGNGFSWDVQMTCVQLLNKTAGGGTPIGPVIDPVYGDATSGSQNGQQNRYGGEIRGLSNGNFVSVIEDRTTNFPGATGRMAIGRLIDGNTGLWVGPAFNTNTSDTPFANCEIWGGVAAFNGGFAVKPHFDATGHKICFFDNNATPKGNWQRVIRTDPASPPANNTTEYSSSISDNGRGDGFRIDSDIRSKYVYFCGRGIDSPTGTAGAGVYVTKIDSDTRLTVGEIYVNDGFGCQPDRVNVCSDANDNVFVCWNDRSNNGNEQIAGRFFDKNLKPLSDAFLVFQSSEAGDGFGFKTAAPSCAMINGRVLVTARVSGDMVGGKEYINQDQLAIVLKAPIASSVSNWEKY